MRIQRIHGHEGVRELRTIIKCKIFLFPELEHVHYENRLSANMSDLEPTAVDRGQNP